MWRNCNLHTLLVRMWNTIVTGEKQCGSFSIAIPKRTENICSHENLHTNVHGGTIYHSQKMETGQLFVSWWIDKQIVVCSHSGTSLSHWKEWSFGTFCNVDEPWKHYAEWKKLDTLVWNTQNSQVHRDRTEINNCQRLENERMGNGSLMSVGFPFGVIKIEVDSGDTYIYCECTTYHWISHFKMIKMVNFMLRIFYQSEKVVKKKINRQDTDLEENIYKIYIWQRTCIQNMSITPTNQ